MKVTTDGCLFGAWVAEQLSKSGIETASASDIGAGTGLLSMMIVQKNPGILIDAIEMDEEAAKQAQENINDSPWNDRIQLICADARVYQFADKFDFIISNPPFYENELKGDNTKRNIAHHNEGLLLPELLSLIRKNLKPNGKFFMLLPYKRNDEIKELILEHEFDISEMVFVRQSLKHDYFRLMLSGSLTPDEATQTNIDEISIWDEEQRYTPAFTALLKDYYLHL